MPAWVFGRYRPIGPMSGPRQDRARKVGAIVGFGIPAALALAAFVVAVVMPRASEGEADFPTGAVTVLAFGGCLGAAVGFVQGWRAGPWVASLDGPPGAGTVARFALRAVLLGAAAVAILIGVGALAEARPDGAIAGLTDTVGAIGWALAVAAGWGSMALMYGLAFVGIPAWIGAVLIVAAWARLVRAVVGSGPDMDCPPAPAEVMTEDVAVGSTPGPSDRPPPSGHPRSTDLGWLGAGLVLVVSLGLTTLRASAGATGLGLTLLALLATLAAFAGPGLVGLVGAATGSRTVLIAAGIACVPLSALAFSGVTLVMLAPACLFLYAGLKPSATTVDRPTGRLRVAAVAALLVVGGFAPFLATDTVCWDRYADSSMGVIVRLSPDEPNGPSDVTVVGSGCDGGQTSLVGGSIAIAAVVLAVVLASRDPRRVDRSDT